MRKISERKRVVVKVGTSTLTHRTGRLNIRRVENLVKTLADLQNAGHEELAARREKWTPREPKVKTGYLARYASMVTSADKGAILKSSL